MVKTIKKQQQKTLLHSFCKVYTQVIEQQDTTGYETCRIMFKMDNK